MDDGEFSLEEFQDFLEQFKCRSLVCKSNVKEVINELARQELIQKPHDGRMLEETVL